MDMVDNDCDGLIDCADPDCDGVPPCPVARKDPTLIRFGRGGLDLLRGHATLDMTPVDLGAMPVGVLLGNPHDVIYRGVLPAGALTASPTGTIFRFSNPAARSVGGFYALKIKQRGDGSAYAFSFAAYGDLSAATDPLMRLQIYIGDAPDARPFITTDAPWTRTSSGWRAPKDH